MSALLRCECKDPSGPTLETTWLAVNTSTVSALINHWARGHKVSCIRAVRLQVIAMCNILQMTGWRPDLPDATTKKGVTPHVLLLRHGAVHLPSASAYVFKGKSIFVEWLDDQSDQHLTEYFKDYLDVDEVIRRG